jgi:hypothetical protein
MKYAFAALALAALARAQSRDDIPECALPCLDKAIKDNSDCSVEDTACVCGAFDAIRGDASTCVIDACGIDTALNEVLPATEALCKNAGEQPASSSAAEETSEAPATSTEVATETSISFSATVTEEPDYSTPVVTLSSTVVVPTNGTSTVAPPSETTPGAPEESGSVPPEGSAAMLGSMGGLAMLALGALAL